MPVLINLLGFIWCWLALVLGAFYDLVGPALTAFGCWMALHLFYSRTRAADLRLILAAVLLGPLNDVLLLQGGWMSYAAHAGGPLPPVWIAAAWANFALILNHAMSWLHGRRVLAAALGALAGPLSYLAGTALGAVSPGAPTWIPLLILAVGWALVWPLLETLTVPRPSGQRHLSGRAAG